MTTPDLAAALRQALAALESCNSNDGDDPWYDAKKVASAIETARAALAATAAPAETKPVAWGLFAMIGDEWVLQHPVRFTERDAYADRMLYEPGALLDVRPLYEAARPAAPAPSEPMSPIEKLGQSIETALDDAPAGDVLKIITGAFVSLTVELVRRAGHDVTKAIQVDGGDQRDITIHAPKE